MNKFWEKVHKCEHKNMNQDYFKHDICCDAIYCIWIENHCLDCGVYITHCSCGSNNGMSGWPEKRCRINKKKEN